MTNKIVRGEELAPLTPLSGRTVAVLGYGNQGRAHSANLRDSGVSVVVGGRSGSDARHRAADDGFDALDHDEAVARADLVVMAVPDEAQPSIFDDVVEPALTPGAIVGFLHGFNIRYGFVNPAANVGVIMVAPKGPGHTLRELFVEGAGIPCLFAVHQDSTNRDAEAIGLAWANGIGCARSGIIYTTFAHEAETDLFGEQAVLCGGMSALILAAFETLVDAGYPPELAYLECCHEAKQVADLVYSRGLAGMYRAISNTAEFGAYRAGPRVVDESVRQRLRTLLEEIRSGEFAQAIRTDYQSGFPWFADQRTAAREHPIEPAGEVIRALMPWLQDPSRQRAKVPKES